MSYDGENRLTKANITAGGSGSYNYAYDDAGNLSSYEGTPYSPPAVDHHQIDHRVVDLHPTRGASSYRRLRRNPRAAL